MRPRRRGRAPPRPAFRCLRVGQETDPYAGHAQRSHQLSALCRPLPAAGTLGLRAELTHGAAWPAVRRERLGRRL
jgi:hypothetical protein